MKRRLRIGFIFAVLLSAFPVFGIAGEAASPEYRVKAALLYNFARFVEWPKSAFPAAGEDGDGNGEIALYILGKSPFGNAIDLIRGKKVMGRTLSVRHIVDVDALNVRGPKSPHILFICGSETKKLPAIFARLQAHPVLTVSDLAKFAKAGGMIGLVKAGGKVRFEINTAAAAGAGLKISSRLLKIARIVK